MLASQQASQLFQPPIAPNPAVQSQRNAGAADNRQTEEGQPRPAGCLSQAVKHEQRQKGDQNTGSSPTDRLDHLDRPDQLAEIVELVLQGLGQFQTVGRSHKAHRTLLKSSRRLVSLCITVTDPRRDFSISSAQRPRHSSGIGLSSVKSTRKSFAPTRILPATSPRGRWSTDGSTTGRGGPTVASRATRPAIARSASTGLPEPPDRESRGPIPPKPPDARAAPAARPHPPEEKMMRRARPPSPRRTGAPGAYRLLPVCSGRRTCPTLLPLRRSESFRPCPTGP